MRCSPFLPTPAQPVLFPLTCPPFFTDTDIQTGTTYFSGILRSCMKSKNS